MGCFNSKVQPVEEQIIIITKKDPKNVKETENTYEENEKSDKNNVMIDQKDKRRARQEAGDYLRDLDRVDDIETWKKLIEKLNSNKKFAEYVNARPRQSFKNVNELADYLRGGPYNTELEKVWLIYVWITFNIDYDVEGFLSDNYGINDARNVLLRGKCVCAGYTELFKQLCIKLDIECVYITGYSKASGYEIGQKITKADHAWNAFKFSNGKWHFVEATWGAGTVEGSKFSKKFNPYYFATPPHIFNEKHFSESFRLENEEMTLDDFEIAQSNDIQFHLHGLKCTTNRSSAIQTQYNPLVIEYISDQRLEFLTELKDEDNNELKNLVLIQSDFSTKNSFKYCLIIDIPKKLKKYTLSLYGKGLDQNVDLNFSYLTKYKIILTKDELNKNLPKYNLSYKYGLVCSTYKTSAITAQKNPLIIEYYSNQQITFLIDLKDANENEIKNAGFVQSDFSSSHFKYCLALFLPEKMVKYNLSLFGKINDAMRVRFRRLLNTQSF